MSKRKLTKGELKRQRDSLRQFERYLPTLQLKKQQLQMKILEAQKFLYEKEKNLSLKEESIHKWVGLLADPAMDMLTSVSFSTDENPFKKWIIPEGVDVDMMNIAGANVPELKDVHFHEAKYDFYSAPYWLDRGIEELRAFIRILLDVKMTKEKIQILKKELRVTTQRVNLFEKIKIPECLENIRKIRIYLGDLQANAVGISKVAKKKIEASMAA